jgi:hypothetical protein
MDNDDEGPGMSVQLGRPGTGTDRPVLAVAVITAVVTVIGAGWLVQAAIGGGVAHRTVRVDNRAGLAVQVDAVVDGGRLGLGEAGPGATTTFLEVADLGDPWTFVVTYGGREVARQTLTDRELAASRWTVQIPDAATAELERQGFR